LGGDDHDVIIAALIYRRTIFGPDDSRLQTLDSVRADSRAGSSTARSLIHPSLRLRDSLSKPLAFSIAAGLSDAPEHRERQSLKKPSRAVPKTQVKTVGLLVNE
jgi:hypothetical protein